MKRYLLFDANCLKCSSFAHSIEQQCAGRLELRSLSDPEMQMLQTQAQQWRRWQPTLLEVESGHVRAYTGVRLRLQLCKVLGLHQAWQIAESLHLQNTAQPHKGERRVLLKRTGLVVGGVAVALGFEQLKPASHVFAQNAPPDRSQLVTHRLNPAKMYSMMPIQDSGIVTTASAHFGTPDWANSNIAWLKSDPGKLIYQIFYMQTNPGINEQKTFLLMTMAPGQPPQGLVCQIIVPPDHTLVINVLTPDSQLIGTVDLLKIQITLTPRANTQPHDFGTCFVNSIGDVSSNCLELCKACADIPGPEDPACVACVACAGRDALWRMAICAFS